jgi:hypothetical protein
MLGNLIRGLGSSQPSTDYRDYPGHHNSLPGEIKVLTSEIAALRQELTIEARLEKR